MIFIYKCTILVCMIKTLSCAEYRSCPSFYLSSDGVSHVKVEIATPNDHNNRIKFHVELSVGGSVSEHDLDNSMTFLGTTEDITNNRPLTFRLDLPPNWSNFETKLTAMTINDQKLCSSDRLDPKYFQIITVINKSQTVSVSITSGSSNNPMSSSTLPPIPYGYTHVTQTPSIWTYHNTPIPNEPSKQDETSSKKSKTSSKQDENCFKSPGSELLIYSGSDVENRVYPWIGAMMVKEPNKNQTFICGATLITKKRVLTAGHCIKPELVKYIVILFGIIDLNVPEFDDDRQIRDVLNYAIHPDYNLHTADADIAILELRQELQITDAVKPICLCNYEECFLNIKNQTGVVAGWGRTENTKFLATLKQVHTPIVPLEECRQSSTLFRNITSKRTFCAGEKNGRGPCDGDSGSGFYMFVRGIWAIRGIVSSSLSGFDNLCDQEQYIVYTDVVQHFKWIEDNL